MNPDHGAHVAETQGLKRSAHWETVKNKFLEKNAVCAACGPARSPKKALQVHHRQPFHYCVLAGRPDLELDFRNLITLCETEAGEGADNHHVLLGHLSEFHSYNPDVWDHATGRYHGRSRAEIEADLAYQEALQRRPKKWAEMSEEERQEFRVHLDAIFPPLKWDELSKEMQAACRAERWTIIHVPATK